MCAKPVGEGAILTRTFFVITIELYLQVPLYSKIMTQLTQIAITTRKIIRYVIYFIIFLIVGRMLLGIGIGIFNSVFPKPPPAPTVAFGKLPKLVFPEKKDLPKFSYKLDTVTGELPALSTQAIVYYMPC